MRRLRPATLLLAILPATSATGPRALAQLMSSWAAANPLRTTFAAATARGIIGDLSAQRMEQGSGASTVDRQRLFLYTAFTNLIALVYDRPIYVHLFPRYFPTLVDGRRCWSNIIKATLVDNLITSPFLYFPLFYLFKDCVIRGSHAPLGALRHCADELPSQMVSCLAFWLPTTSLSQGFVPVHLRIAFLSVAACGWVSVLSITTNALDRGT